MGRQNQAGLPTREKSALDTNVSFIRNKPSYKVAEQWVDFRANYTIKQPHYFMNSMLPKILYFALHGLTFKVNSPSSVDNESLCLIRGSRPTLLGTFLYTFSLVLVDILQMKQSCTTKSTSTSGIASFLVKSATKNSNFILKQKVEFHLVYC